MFATVWGADDGSSISTAWPMVVAPGLGGSNELGPAPPPVHAIHARAAIDARIASEIRPSRARSSLAYPAVSWLLYRGYLVQRTLLGSRQQRPDNTVGAFRHRQRRSLMRQHLACCTYVRFRIAAQDLDRSRHALGIDMVGGCDASAALREDVDHASGGGRDRDDTVGHRLEQRERLTLDVTRDRQYE